ncbi:MAG: PAS domain-containing protein [Deltaproteobacteria bacterium]|nr:PAS domain-containing protein [Deltaproteobacteria bacterium]
MKRKRFLLHIYPSYLLIIIVSLIAATYYSSNYYRKFFLQQTYEDLKSRGELLKYGIRDLISYPASLDQFCKQTGKDSSTRITVILPDGVVIADSKEDPANMENHKHRPELIDAFKGNVSSISRFSDTLKKEMMYVALPIGRNHVVRAVIRTSISISVIHNKVGQVRYQVAVYCFFIAMFASVIAFFISKKITQPIEEMTKGAEYFSNGDLSRKLVIPDSKEMADLAQAMNSMASQLDDKIKTTIKQKNELDSVLSSMQEGVIALDQDNAIISINPSAASIFHVKPKDVRGFSIEESIRNHSLLKFIADAAKSQTPIERDVMIYDNTNKRIVYIHSAPLMDAEKKTIGLLVILNDVTKLRQLQNIRQDFAANVSHEIKTPLTSIKGFIETLLNESNISEEERDRFYSVIERNVSRLNAIIEDLLHLSQIEQIEDKNQLTLIETDLADVITNAVQACTEKANEKDITIEKNQRSETTIKADPQLIEQAMINLIDNAIKYSHEKSHIIVESQTGESEAILKVSDNGPGIAQEHLNRLFERFYRVDKGRSRKLGGTGLGLAIVKHIVMAHNGRINVESQLEKGSTFSISLPF